MAIMVTKARRIITWWREKYYPPSNVWVEIDDRGIWLKAKRWPFRPWMRLLPWEDVKEIHAEMRDCYTMHVLCLVFMKADGKWVRVDEVMKGWTDLVAILPQRFAGFDLESYRRIESLAPSTGSALCWSREKNVE